MSQTISYAADFPSRREAINDYIKAVADRDTKFLSMFLKLSDPVENIKYEWVDKTLVGFKDTLSVALASSTTTVITVASGSTAPKRYIDTVSTLLIDNEILLVTSTITVVATFSSLCVTRAQQGSTASTHALSSQVVIMGNPRNEGFSAGRDDSQKGVRRFNYTQIFERQLKLSGSSQSVKAVDAEMQLNKQAADLFPELMKELSFAFIYGNQTVADTTEYTDRRMGGFRYYAQTYGNTPSVSGSILDFNMIDDVIESYLNGGGDATKLGMACSIRQQRKVNDLKQARVIQGGMTQSEMGINNFVEKYDFGSRAHVNLYPITELRDDEVYFFQEDLISVHPLADRGWKKKPLPEDGDFVRQLLLGEYTAVFRNPHETLFYLSGLAK